MKNVKSRQGRSILSARARGPLRATTIALLLSAAAAFAPGGCAPTPVHDVESAEALSVRILADSTRLFRPGMRRRYFRVRIRNESSERIAFDGLRIVFAATPAAHPELQTLQGNWRYPLEMVIDPGKHAVIPLTPEPQEFPLEQLAPGEYDIRASVLDRFVSEPFRIRVSRPDIRGARPSR